MKLQSLKTHCQRCGVLLPKIGETENEIHYHCRGCNFRRIVPKPQTETKVKTKVKTKKDEKACKQNSTKVKSARQNAKLVS